MIGVGEDTNYYYHMIYLFRIVNLGYLVLKWYLCLDMFIDMLSRNDLSSIILDRYQHSDEPRTIKAAIHEVVQTCSTSDKLQTQEIRY